MDYLVITDVVLNSHEISAVTQGQLKTLSIVDSVEVTRESSLDTRAHITGMCGSYEFRSFVEMPMKV